MRFVSCRLHSNALQVCGHLVLQSYRHLSLLEHVLHEHVLHEHIALDCD
jgi:hypothetical protein